MVIRFFLIFALIITPLLLKSQDKVITFRGQILDSKTSDPIPFANLRLNNFNYGTSTNLEGRFELKLTRDRFSGDNLLSISCIGYKTLLLKLLGVDPLSYQTIKLVPDENALDDVIVRSSRAARRENNQAKTIVMDAISSIPSNRAKSSYLAKTFYRHYCKEGDDYVRLTEAAIDLRQFKGKGTFVQIPEQRLQFGLQQMRRSFDYTKFAKLSHPPISLNFLISNDLMNYEFHNPIRRKLDSYQFIIDDTTSYDSEAIIVIEFEPKDEKQFSLNYSGKLYINLTNKAIIRADIKETRSYSNRLDSISSVVDKQVFYQKIGYRYYPQRMISDVAATHFSVNTEGKMTNPVIHQSHVELLVNDIKTKSKVQFSAGEPSEEELRNINYDSLFWKSYTVLEATPLEQKIIDDLSKKVKLNKQFEAINRLKEGVKTIVENTKFQQALTDMEEIPVYTVLWAKWSIPNFYDLIPSPYLRKMIKKGKVKLLMVSLDENEQDWLTNREIYGFDKPYIAHKRVPLGFGDEIVMEFYKSIVPDFLMLNNSREIVDHSPPLPSEIDVKAYYQYLLKHQSVETPSR
ncbi:carboxypeptidase-like regulatory domain-containing protein [Roseivirga misakiensis]|uniref:Carboxypeptidase-like regulatory domain-containing protein n=1 Tax=Roseivirga misakiensis TaxID=1563681 RepID=A0A1E5T0A9_9BACT|nr:carboxypeptidase-like regulatory domain-containing protein [Roseivirga misakiensis]OEK04799.1 hypothetical protein BFP71_15250 [Roseivirga misakiensis]